MDFDQRILFSIDHIERICKDAGSYLFGVVLRWATGKYGGNRLFQR